jgi:hypothetical protein
MLVTVGSEAQNMNPSDLAMLGHLPLTREALKGKNIRRIT